MTIEFGTKMNLFNLNGVIKLASIARLMTINFAEWQSRKSNIITDIKSKLGENLLIVRSSSFDETLMPVLTQVHLNLY